MPKQYDAFVSYKHGRIGPLSKVLASGLRTFARPLFARPRNVFRDEEHLAPDASLPALIGKALERSRFMILLASPEAAQSPWVERELRVWCEELGRTDRLLIVLVEGSLETDAAGGLIDWSRTDALPAVLQTFLTDVPFFVDLRSLTSSRDADVNHPAVKAAIARIVARLENVEPQELIGLEVVQHRQRLRLRNGAIAVLSALTVTSGTAALYANSQRLAQQRSTFAALANALSAQVRPDTTGALDERNALVARQAFLFAERSQRPASDAVHRALRTALAPEHFTTSRAATIGFVTHVAANQDGDVIAAASDSAVQVWTADLPRGTLTWQLDGDPQISALAVDAAGRWLAAGTKGDGLIRLWDLSASSPGAAQPQTLSGHTLDVDDLAFDEEGGRLASASADGTVKVWTLPPREETPQTYRHFAEVRTVSFAGDRMMSRTSDGQLHVWASDGTGSSPVVLFRRSRDGGMLEISPSGRWLLDVDFASKDLRLRDLQQRDGQITQWTSPAGEITAAAFSPSEQQVAVGTSDGQIVVWNMDDPASPARIASGHRALVTDLAFFGTDAIVTAGGQDGYVRIRHLNTATQSLKPLNEFGNARFGADDEHLIGLNRKTLAPAIRSLAVEAPGPAVPIDTPAPAGAEWYLSREHAVSVDFERKKGSVWRASPFAEVHQFAFAAYTGDKPSQVIVSDDGRVLAWVDRYDMSVWVQDLTRSDATVRKLHDQPIRQTIQSSLAPDGSSASVLSLGVRDWSAPVAISPDNRRLAMGAGDGTVRVWPLDQPAAQPFVLSGLGGWPLSLAFAADGSALAVSTSQRTIRVWDFTARQLRTLRGHEGRVDALSFAPDRRLLASAGAEGTVRLWDLDLDEPQPIVLEAGGSVNALAFSPSGRRLATSDGDSTRVWTVAASALADHVCDAVTRNLSLDEWRDLVGADIPYERTCTSIAVHASLLDTARALARVGALADAELIVRQARQADPEHTRDWKQEVDRAVADGRLVEAEDLARSGDVDAAVRMIADAVARGATLATAPEAHAKRLAAEGLMAQANRLTREADLPTAISLLDRAIALAPTADAYEARGTALRAHGDDAKARLDFDRVIELDPIRWEAFARRGEVLASQEDWEPAYDDYTEALRLMREERNALGPIDISRLGVADALTMTLVVLESSTRDILLRRAEASVKLKDFTGALADYARLAQQYPRNADVLYGRGRAYMESGRCDNAIADFGGSLTLEPKHWRAYVARAICYRETGNAVSGRADLMAAKALEPNNTLIDTLIETYPRR